MLGIKVPRATPTMRLNSGCGRKMFLGDAYAQSFALLRGEEGTFASIERKFLAKVDQGAVLSLIVRPIGTMNRGWHPACKCCYVQIGIGEGIG